MSPASAVEVTEHKAELDDIRMHYRIAGSGAPLVLLHGFPETSYAWRKVIPPLAEHFTVITPDLRGCGETDRPSSGYDKRTVAGDVRQLVDRLALGPVNLVGHDVGMEAALPGLGLKTLFDPPTYPRMYHLPLFDAPNGLAEALITGRERSFVAHFMLQQAQHSEALDEQSLDRYSSALAAPGCLHAGIEYFRQHVVDAPRNREHATTMLAMPVLTVGGTASFGAHLEEQIAPLVEHQQHVMLDSGHYLAEEQPDQLAALLLDFFSGSHCAAGTAGR